MQIHGHHLLFFVLIAIPTVVKLIWDNLEYITENPLKVDDTVIAAIRNLTKAFGIIDEIKTDLFDDTTSIDGTEGFNSAYHDVAEQLDKFHGIV